MNAQARAIQPHRALLHPVFLGALALMALNDHVFKGQAVLPAWLTGKLSDFAGPVVAVVLLSAMLARRREDAVMAAGVVAAGFAAINLWPEVARVAEVAVSALGITWRITQDPTDLIGLVTLPLALHLVYRTAAEPTGPWTTSHAAAAMVAAAACAGTSMPPTLFFQADLVLLNNTPETLTLQVSHLRDSVDLDCDAIALEPGGLLSPLAFDDPEPVVLAPKQQVAAWAREARPCFALRVEADGLPPALLFWTGALEATERTETLPRRSNPDPQTIAIVRDGQGGLVAQDTSDEGVLFPPPLEAFPEATAECAIDAAQARLTWTAPPPDGRYIIMTQVPVEGADGCLDLALIDSRTEAPSSWQVCSPSEVLPLLARRLLDLKTEGEPGQDRLELTLFAEDGEAVETSMLLARGGEGVQIAPVDLNHVEVEGCQAVVDACGAVRIAARLQGLDGVLILGSGDQASATGSGLEAEVLTGRISRRIVVDRDCEVDRPELGPELEAVIVTRPLVQED